MSTSALSGVRKVCCKCGREVGDAPRMKDHHGRYWCLPCGQAEEKRKAHVACGICEACGNASKPDELLEIGGKALCAACRQKKFGHAHLPSGGLLGSFKSMFRH